VGCLCRHGLEWGRYCRWLRVRFNRYDRVAVSASPRVSSHSVLLFP
jgi:hypothetical protein